MVKPIYVYVSVAVISFILSNIWLIRRNNSFEGQIMDKYEAMIHSLHSDFASQKEMIEDVNRYEIEWHHKEFERKLKLKRDSFHEQISGAYESIESARHAVYDLTHQSRQNSEKTSYLKKELDDTQDHYDQIADIANKHIMDLEEQVLECESKNKDRQTELSHLLSSVPV
eukprot:150559_1